MKTRDYMSIKEIFRILVVILTALLICSCASTTHYASKAKSQGGEVYSFAAEAVAAFDRAVQAGDTKSLLKILGPEGAEILESGDAVADRRALSDFAEKMREENRLEPQAKDQYVLLVGKDEWPLPIPLVKKNEKWSFDTLQGKEEILNRRIGENELKTIRVSRAYVQAQKEYFKQDRNGDGVREYAQRIASSEGTRDGLYWKSSNVKDQSPLGPFTAEAATEGYRRHANEPVPYHGYYYKILTAQGEAAIGGKKSYINNRGQMTRGFALVAYPARWGSSGIMTFIVNRDGLVFEKDLGVQTLSAAQSMQYFNPDASWHLADLLNQEALAE